MDLKNLFSKNKTTASGEAKTIKDYLGLIIIVAVVCIFMLLYFFLIKPVFTEQENMIKDKYYKLSETEKMNSQIKNKAVYWGTGRRKTSVARVRLIPGNGLIKINGRAGDDYLNFNPLHLNSIKAPLQTLGLENSYDILVNVFGGGLTGQADAIKQGAARALCELSPDNRKPLKTEGHLSRDPRAKERRKYGLKKARKAPQFSKR